MEEQMDEAIKNQGNRQFQFERLPDPLGDRVMKEVPLPPLRPLSLT